MAGRRRLRNAWAKRGRKQANRDRKSGHPGGVVDAIHSLGSGALTGEGDARDASTGRTAGQPREVREPWGEIDGLHRRPKRPKKESGYLASQWGLSMCSPGQMRGRDGLALAPGCALRRQGCSQLNDDGHTWLSRLGRACRRARESGEAAALCLVSAGEAVGGVVVRCGRVDRSEPSAPLAAVAVPLEAQAMGKLPVAEAESPLLPRCGVVVARPRAGDFWPLDLAVGGPASPSRR